MDLSLPPWPTIAAVPMTMTMTMIFFDYDDHDYDYDYDELATAILEESDETRVTRLVT